MLENPTTVVIENYMTFKKEMYFPCKSVILYKIFSQIIKQ